MPIHLYCLLPAPGDAEPGDPAVRAIDVDGIIAWVGSTDETRLSREGRRVAARALEHDRVIAQALARGITPMPATLADPYPDDASLRRDIAARAAEIRETLARVAGCVEMAVIMAGRADDSMAPDVAEGPGRAYLERLRNLPGDLGAVGDDIDRRVGPLAIAASRRATNDRLGLSHLVGRTDVDSYRSAVLGAASGRIRLVVDGPRAPYSFAAFAPRIEAH